MAEAFPLQWPDGWPRTTWRRPAKYKVGFGTARDHLLNELRRMGARHVVLSTNIPTRLDGLPYADAPKRVPDPGVAVYFLRNNEQQVVACDKWDSPAANVRAVGLTVEALRGIERAGASELLDRAFTGFKALPPKGEASTGAASPAWWNVLSVSADASMDVVEAAFRALAFKNHPDRGGDAGAMAMITRAREEARAVKGGR